MCISSPVVFSWQLSFANVCEFSPYTFTSSYSPKNTKGHLHRFIKLFIFLNRALISTNPSHWNLSILDLYLHKSKIDIYVNKSQQIKKVMLYINSPPCPRLWQINLGKSWDNLRNHIICFPSFRRNIYFCSQLSKLQKQLFHIFSSLLGIYN